MRRSLTVPLAIFSMLSVLGDSRLAIAHGVVTQYRTGLAIEVLANYDTGEPMSEAQVVVFAPDNPTEPWQTGRTTEDGEYVFIPDPSIPGNWEVQVRQAGHGDIVVVPLDEQDLADEEPGEPGELGEPETAPASQNPIATGGSQPLTPLQRAMMMGSAIWGFVGTAFFFMPRKK